ncbi:MAG: hypothetical protein K2J87_08375, partial [Muribaculaceae bacterium]|nr:hypothetical protein [Muribaculaceae bacterium]
MGAGIHKDELTWRELAASANLNSVRSRIEVYFFNRFTIEVQKWNMTHLDMRTDEDRRQKCWKNGKKNLINLFNLISGQATVRGFVGEVGADEIEGA